MRSYSCAILLSGLLLTPSLGVWAPGLETSSADLPPDGVYVSPYEYHEYAAMGIILDGPRHRPLVDTVFRERVGDDEMETFDSVFTAVEIGQGFGPIVLTGPVVVRTFDRVLSTTGRFDTEIVSMSLSGNSPAETVMIRQDAERASVGSTEITDLGGGLYHIDSFFDVFTELSVDGGGTWVSSRDSTHMFLIPEPVTMSLLALGGAILTRRRRTK